MQERSAVLKQFPAVGRRTACGHLCGPCGRGAVRGGCARVAWGEGSEGRGVGARGPCHGGGNAGTPRAAHLWIPAFAGTTVGAGGWCGGGWELGAAGTASRRAPPLGSRFRGNDGGVGGDGECCWLVGVGALRQAQGERIWEARVRWGGWECGGGRGARGRGRPSPRTCPGFPLSRERRGGGWGRRWGWVGVRWRGGGRLVGFWVMVGWWLWRSRGGVRGGRSWVFLGVSFFWSQMGLRRCNTSL